MQKLVQPVPPGRNVRNDSRFEGSDSAHQSQGLLIPVRNAIRTTITRLNLARELVADVNILCAYTDETIRQSLRLLKRVAHPPPW